MNLGHLNYLNTIHFSILHVILLSDNNCTYKDCETATPRDFFVMSQMCLLLDNLQRKLPECHSDHVTSCMHS